MYIDAEGPHPSRAAHDCRAIDPAHPEYSQLGQGALLQRRSIH